MVKVAPLLLVLTQNHVLESGGIAPRILNLGTG